MSSERDFCPVALIISEETQLLNEAQLILELVHT